MLGGILIAVGLVVLGLGISMLVGWTTGRSRWFSIDVYDRPGVTKPDRMILYATFIAMVLAPLLGGAVLIGYGLHLLF